LTRKGDRFDRINAEMVLTLVKDLKISGAQRRLETVSASGMSVSQFIGYICQDREYSSLMVIGTKTINFRVLGTRGLNRPGGSEMGCEEVRQEEHSRTSGDQTGWALTPRTLTLGFDAVQYEDSRWTCEPGSLRPKTLKLLWRRANRFYGSSWQSHGIWHIHTKEIRRAIRRYSYRNSCMNPGKEKRTKSTKP